QIRTDASAYYGPWKKLLHYLFPLDSGYEVIPQYKRPSQMNGNIDFVALFTIKVVHEPVFFLTIHPPAAFDVASKREEADIHIRDCYGYYMEGVRVPVLHGVSALGTKLSFYRCEADTKEWTPHNVPHEDEYVTDIAPQERWNADVLEEEGARKLQAIVDNVKAMSAQIQISVQHKEGACMRIPRF
ncbi:hypothetical protein BDZ97DRAFT_1653537, partial [Flammula alnicola]